MKVIIETCQAHQIKSFLTSTINHNSNPLIPLYILLRLCKLQILQKSDKIYQLLSNGRWFSPGTPASSTTKTGRHDIAEYC
jgi:hypothetical protein